MWYRLKGLGVREAKAAPKATGETPNSAGNVPAITQEEDPIHE
jgi:hypothetical protein